MYRKSFEVRRDFLANLRISFLLNIDVADFSNELAFSKDEQPAHDPHQLRKIRRDHDDRFAFARCQVPDQSMNLLLGTHIHADRGFIDDENLASRSKPFSDAYLLLVPAAQISRTL